MSNVDWRGAPEWAIEMLKLNICVDTEAFDDLYSLHWLDKLKTIKGIRILSPKAEKVWPESDERVDIICTNGGDGMHYDEFREGQAEAPIGSKYNRLVIGIDGQKAIIDVYRVLDAFKTESAAIDHAVKKLLCAGIRHQKDRRQDLEEAIKSIQAELLLMSQR